MKTKIKPNTIYRPFIKPDGDYFIIIMLQNGWTKRGMYDAENNVWYIIENEDKVEINQSEIYSWFTK